MTTTGKPSTRASASKSSSATPTPGTRPADPGAQVARIAGFIRAKEPDLDEAAIQARATAQAAAAREAWAPSSINGCKVFSSSHHRDHAVMDERVTDFLEWLGGQGGHLLDHQVRQSSDQAYHCLSIVLFYYLPPEPPR